MRRPLGFRHSRSRSEKCVSTHGLLGPCVSFLRMARGMAARFILQPNDKYVVLSIDRREGFAGPSRHIHIMGKISPKAYRARQCTQRVLVPLRRAGIGLCGVLPKPPALPQRNSSRRSGKPAAPAVMLLLVTSSSPDCAASHRPPRPPATRRILPGR